MINGKVVSLMRVP